jgi:hypothetical protein
MPAQALELQLSLAVGGELADLSQAGKHSTKAIEIYHGPNLLALSALLSSFLSVSPASPPSQSMVTIKELLRAGGMEGAIIAQSMKSSSRSTTFQPLHQHFHTAYTPSKSNPADTPSQGKYSLLHLLLPPILLPLCLNLLINSQLLPTPTEIRLQTGPLPRPNLLPHAHLCHLL